MGGGLFKFIIFGVDNLFCCDLGGGLYNTIFIWQFNKMLASLTKNVLFQF